MQAHPEIGDRMLAPLALLEPVRPIVRHHHERWDGTGYPDRLVADEIPLLARIVALADSIEAMSGQRPYRFPLDKEGSSPSSSSAADGNGTRRSSTSPSTSSRAGGSGSARAE